MKQQDNYIAKEAFTFPLICLVCLASFIYYWLILHYVIHPYQLEGIFVK